MDDNIIILFFRHDVNQNVKYGTEYDIYVMTDAANAISSKRIRVKTVPIPTPEVLTTYLDVNSSTHEIMWHPASELPNYLKAEVNAKKVNYKLYVSSHANLTHPLMVVNTSDARYESQK